MIGYSPVIVTFLALMTAGAQFAGGDATASPPADAKLDLFLLIGQSNMAGRGKIEPQDQKAHPRVWKLDKEDQWVPAIDPLHFDKPQAGVGLGLTFGKVIAESDEKVHVGLIPCAVGATSIDQWRKGDKLYDEAVRRAKIATKHGRIAGVLWHQGEADSNPKKIDAYSGKLEQLIADLRKDLDAPDVPFVLGQLGAFRAERVPGTTALNEVLMKFPETHARTACVESTDLTAKPDQTHFDSAGLREFGRRYAAAYLKLAGQPTPAVPAK